MANSGDLLTWTDPDGSTVNLSDPDHGIAVAPGRAGFAMPPMELATETTPGVPGAFLKDVTVNARPLTIPMTVWADTREALRHTLRDLGSRMNPLRGDSYLTSVSLDGTSRRLAVRYVDGLQGGMGRDVRGMRHQRLVVVCQALQPYWEDADPTTMTWAGEDAATWFPLLPLTLGSSSIIDAEAITNLGDVATPPTWTITGPGRALVLTNGTDELSTRAPHWALDPGDELVIDTDAKTVTINGASAFADIDPVSVFWPLEPGGNTVTLSLAGATTDSSVTLTYRRRWLSA